MKNIKLIKYFAMFWLLIFIILSVLIFASSVLNVRSANIIKNWENNQDNINTETADKYIKRLELSSNVNPFDGNTYFLLGKLYSLLAKSITTDNNYQKKSLENYLKSLSIEPFNGLVWAKLASLYDITSQEDLAISALNNSINLTPFERDTQELTIPLIIKYYQPSQKNHTLDLNQAEKVISHAMKFHVHSQLTISSAKKQKKLKFILPFVSNKNHTKQINNLLNRN